MSGGLNLLIRLILPPGSNPSLARLTREPGQSANHGFRESRPECWKRRGRQMLAEGQRLVPVIEQNALYE